MMQKKYYTTLLICFTVFSCPSVFAQRDSSKTKAVNIISSFKPLLRESAKINFNATPPASDSTKPQLQYNIPNQNLALAFQPGSLNPLALQIDSGGKWDNSNYIKLGFGSLKTPFLQAGFSIGDGKNAGVNIYAKHVSSQGKQEFKDFSNTGFGLKGFYKTAGNKEWNVSLGAQQSKTYKYGFLPDSLLFPADSLKQNFQTISARVGLHNIEKTAFGLSYSPEIKIDVFSDNHKNNESNSVINLPLQKTAGNDFRIDLGLTFDLTRYSPKNKTVINNTIYYISPSIIYKTSTVNIQAGIRPSWDNGRFKMFPNVLGEIGTSDQRFVFQAGWSGYIRKTTYQYLASQNPWLWAPARLTNTWVQERFAGFKGSIADHFTYSIRAALNKLNNQPLFVNDTTKGNGGKSFDIVYEPRINVIQIAGQIAYNVQEKFSLKASWAINQYSGLKVQKKAWGLIPLELNVGMRVQVIQDLWVNADLFSWGGPQARKNDGIDNKKLGSVLDLNTGFEFKIAKNINLWAQFNNITNNEYQRWSQYNVYGFNFVGGVVFSFAQKN